MIKINTTNHSPKMQNFITRLMSTIIILPPVLYAVYSGGLLYFLLLLVAVLLSGYEWSNICGKWSFGLDGMVLITFMTLGVTSFYMDYVLLGCIFIIFGGYLTYITATIRGKSEKNPIIPKYLNRSKWLAIGAVYIGVGISSLSYMHNLGTITLVWVLLGTIFNDVFAYIFGSIIGGKKIAPKISPGKSWSGFTAAALSTMFLGYIFAFYVGSNNEITIMIIGLFMAVFAHLGDMTESAFKRYINIKDTSNLIPGHGGILDRMDALLLVGVYIMLVSIIIGKSPLAL